jgi:osmoprotectant transport system permease protein
MSRAHLVLLTAVLVIFAGCGRRDNAVVIGSKSFTEGVILGEMLRALTLEAGLPARHLRALGGTRLVFDALASGEIDAYVEYTGTLRREIFASAPARDLEHLDELLAARGIVLAGPVGFQNNYALGMLAADAERLGISKVSDLVRHPDLRLRFSNEFMDRTDGWPGLRAAYGLPQRDVLGVEHDLAYRAIEAHSADITELYTTDAEIAHYGLRLLEDDRGFFPRYEAVLLYRADLEQRNPGAVAALKRVLGLIDEMGMVRLNAAVKIDGRSEAEVAAAFLAETVGLRRTLQSESRMQRLLRHTREHLLLVGLSLAVAIVVAVPLGIVAARRPRVGQFLLGLIGIAQTIPALALLVVMVPLLGIGAGPALVALFIYSLLPIVRNTHAGLTGIPASLLESADALGLPRNARLWHIELPLALPTILAGIKTAAVINVGGATLGALVGAGGYGQPILTGIRLDDTALILEGAVPAALMAIGVQWLFELAERYLMPGGRQRVEEPVPSQPLP